MESISSFAELTAHLTSVNCRKRMAVANAVDSHTLEAVLQAVDLGIVEAFLIGDVASIESPLLFEHNLSPFIHIIDRPEVLDATLEAVRMVKSGEADILMKGLVNTDVLLRAILDKEKGLLPPGNVLTYNAAMEIPKYHKLLFFSDPVVIPSPSLVQRTAMIKYAIT
ncbi:MAG: phosphate acyltransferase, partial [Paludibacter sp.]